MTSVGLSAAIFLLFQLFGRWDVRTFPAIVINYGVAASIGWILAGGSETFAEVHEQTWVPLALVMGLLFIYLFQLIARSTQEIGVTVTSIAAKLSMVIPVAIFLLFDAQDELTVQKGIAIALSVPAIMLASWKPGESRHVSNWTIPLIIFIGSGMIDLMFAGYSGPEHMTRVELRYLFASLPLITAFFAGLIWHARASRIHGTGFMPGGRTWAAGVSLGAINFGSLYFLLETYDKVGIDRSAVMPVNNLAIILLSSGLSVAFLQERLVSRNYLGLLLGASAIALLLWDAIIG